MTKPKYIRKPFDRLPLKQRAIYILHLAGFTNREIGKLLATDFTWVNRLISKSYNKYYDEIATKLPDIEENND
jgi:DNA-directed RNA polymerase specialized sigma24 family protein